MFHLHDDSSGHIYCTLYSWFCPIMPLPILPKEGIYIHWSQVDASGDSTNSRMLCIQGLFFFILTYKITPEKQHWNLIMKLAGPLVALFINKRNTTWPTAMTPMLLLDTDQIRMILYYGCLSSES